MARGETYEQFVEKFKPKKTTDDCHTPQEVYDVVADWVTEEYGYSRDQMLRPFYPGGDYEHFEYPAGTCVVDNPPFSILSKIMDFYQEHGIKYFLFAPELTVFSTIGTRPEACAIIIRGKVTYENGAKINTGFVTNMDSYRIRTVPELSRRINAGKKRSELPKYRYPKNIITVSRLGSEVVRGKALNIHGDQLRFVRALDHQRRLKKKIFGGGFIISDRTAEGIAQYMPNDVDIEWELSEDEQAIIEELNKHGH